MQNIDKNFKFGLKLWSTNKNYIKAAEELYDKGVFHYIEIYSIPNSLDQIDVWKKLTIPFIIHAPHYGHNVNLAKKEQKESNMKHLEEALKFANILNAEDIIFHPGIAGDIQETVKQINELNDERIIIENKPYFIEKDNSICNGATFEEIQFVLNNTNVNFCLDIGHAICAANALKIDRLDFIKQLLKLKPKMFHLTDNEIDSIYDKHFHFGAGSLPIKKILKLLPQNIIITVETYKDYENKLDDFQKDLFFLKGI
ncbi:MAG: sugar phosphate isomerase/epimerase [bacterium]|nr:sugar phosphate isomerase/epimerase [bacterium]